jgi:S1-C subfamily serine protease
MTKCPKCGYERMPIDEVINAAECPKCGIVYAKWKAAAVTENNAPIKKASEPPSAAPSNCSPSNINPILKYAIIVVAAIVIINSFLVPFIIKYSQKEKTEPKNVAITPSASLPESPENYRLGNVPETKLSENPVINVPSREEGKLSLSDIVRRNTRSVVVVKTARGVKGSGFFINDQGFIATNKHVLSDSGNAEIKTSSGNIYKINRIVATDVVGDLVIASTETPANEIFPVALTSSIPDIGEQVIVIGNPLGFEGLEQTVSDGIISGVRSSPQAVKYIQVSAPISPGNSGGPLLNMRGEVIGVATFQYTQGQNLNFCVAAERVIALQNGKSLATNQAERGSLKTPSKRDVYCYVDSQSLVHFVDWNAGILISKPDGSLDGAKYEKWVLDEVGVDPNSIDPVRDAQLALDQYRDELFKRTFPHKSDSEKDLTVGEQQMWENIQNRYYNNAYNKSVLRRNSAINKYNYMIQQFKKYISSR